MCRTVEDAVRLLEVISGYDPADPITELSTGKIPESYLKLLDKDGLRGARLGVFRFYTERRTTDSQVLALFNKAIEDMKTSGAVIVDPFEIPRFSELTKDIWRDMFQYDVDNYFASLGERAPVKTILDVYNSGKFSLYIKERLYRALQVPRREAESCQDIYHEPRNIRFRDAVLEAMEDQNVDFIIYPTWSNPPRKLLDEKSPVGDNSQLIPPHTGMPAFSIPMGFAYKKLPAGLQIVGKLFAEPDLIRVAYAYEQATRHRRPPKKFR
jgi:Asp-tRNA(Asn)/Glu-tRNA(Gln) amidotransferase A subunit family amidase